MAGFIASRCLTGDLPLAVDLRAFNFGSSRIVLELGLFLLLCGIILGLALAWRRANQKARASAIMVRRYGELLQKQFAIQHTTGWAPPAAKNDAEPRVAAEAALRSLAESEARYRSWVGINFDLTEHKRAEVEVIRLNRELQRRADELQTILDILPIGVAIAHDPQCHRITHNPYFSELLDVPAWANASLTAPDNERPTTFTNYRDGVEVPTPELPMQLAGTGVEVRDLELDLVCHGRDPRTMLYYARPLFDEQGHVRGSVGAGLDITDRKRHEKELEDSRRTLTSLVERLREADQKKDEFLSILAHELRNPLAPLRNGLEMIKLALNDGSAVELARTMMERQLAQMVRLIDDLLDLSRVTQGKLTLRKTRIPLAKVVQNAAETSRPLVEQAGHSFAFDTPDEALYVDADEIRLSQRVGGDRMTTSPPAHRPASRDDTYNALSWPHLPVTRVPSDQSHRICTYVMATFPRCQPVFT
jgi:signal transduction histidine kinase